MERNKIRFASGDTECAAWHLRRHLLGRARTDHPGAATQGRSA